MEPITGAAVDSYRIKCLKLTRALHDRTTGLPALPVLFDGLRTLLDARRRIGVLHLEVANLEMVESIYGWQVVDRIVLGLAAALREALGAELPDTALLALNTVAGERFLVFVPEQPGGGEADGAFLSGLSRQLGRRLEAALAHRDLASLSPRLCIRSGHALLAHDPFYRFERCVYAAVEQAQGLSGRLERRRELSWGEELQRIIREQAIDVVFQPLVELRDPLRLLGHEAFARGPQGSMFEAPRAMFALSARVGNSAELDRMCCEAALEAFARSDRSGKLFLNVLPASVAAGSWREGRLPALLASLALAPGDVVFEFSERAIGEDLDGFLATVAGCREAGYGLALDDVGTGKAGRAALERMRPDYLKLEGSLVRQVRDNFILQDLLESLVRLAASMDAEVVAEGIESASDADAVALAGARFGQGFLFAVPAAPGSVAGSRRTVGGH